MEYTAEVEHIFFLKLSIFTKLNILGLFYQISFLTLNFPANFRRQLHSYLRQPPACIAFNGPSFNTHPPSGTRSNVSCCSPPFIFTGKLPRSSVYSLLQIVTLALLSGNLGPNK